MESRTKTDRGKYLKIMIASLLEVVKNIDFIKRLDTNLVSIRDTNHSHYYDVIDNAGLKNLLVVQFDDLVEEIKIEYRDSYKEHPPSENDIKMILEWAKQKMSENNKDFIVQCTAGVSRSSAVAILIQYLQDPSQALKVINPIFHSPNEKVLEIGEKLLNTKDIKEPTRKMLKEHDEQWMKSLENRK